MLKLLHGPEKIRLQGHSWSTLIWLRMYSAQGDREPLFPPLIIMPAASVLYNWDVAAVPTPRYAFLFSFYMLSFVCLKRWKMSAKQQLCDWIVSNLSRGLIICIHHHSNNISQAATSAQTLSRQEDGRWGRTFLQILAGKDVKNRHRLRTYWNPILSWNWS